MLTVRFGLKIAGIITRFIALLSSAQVYRHAPCTVSALISHDWDSYLARTSGYDFKKPVIFILHKLILRDLFRQVNLLLCGVHDTAQNIVDFC